jgi:hypothetical protein
VDLFLRFTVGATGAITAIVTPAVTGGRAIAKGFKLPVAGTQQAVARTGVGAYDCKLAKPWLVMLDDNISVIGADTLTDGTYARVVTDNVTNTTTPKVSIQFYRRDTNAAADVKSGNDVIVHLTLKRDLP